MRKAILSILIASIFLIGTTAWAGIYAPNGYTLSDAAYVGWADSVIDYTGYNASTVNNILGELDKTLAVGATQGGYITLGFDTAITNGSGADFVVWGKRVRGIRQQRSGLCRIGLCVRIDRRGQLGHLPQCLR